MKSRHDKNKEKDHLARLKKQHRTEFFTNLKEVCNLLAGYDLYSKLPVTFLEKVYKHRLHQVGIGFDDEVITRTELKSLREDLLASIKTNIVDLPQGRIELSLLLVEGHSLAFVAKTLKGDEFPAAPETRDVLNAYLANNYEKEFIIKVQEMLFVFSLMVSTVDHYLIWGLMKLQLTETKTALHYTFELEKVMPIKETFVVDGHARPAYRVGWAFPYTGITWAEIKPSQKGITENISMPVFIQAHALQRLEERTELFPGVLQHSVYYSIQNLHYSHTKDGKLLIDYVYHQKKIGYLVGTVEDSRLLLHTFLFITNNGTPEGKKLSELTGLQLLDKKYLAIDKLSTFLSYKINDNAFVKNIFVQAGCGHLLEIEDKNPFLFKPGEELSAETIAHYLKAHSPYIDD